MAVIDEKPRQGHFMSRLISRRLWVAVLLLMVAAFLITRVAFLDSDLPAWKISQLQPIDEFYYTIPAFNLYHYGAMDHRVVAFIPTDGSPLNLLENAMTTITLVAFGNNYYGLRLASVLAGLIALLLVYFVLRGETPRRGEPGTWWFADLIPLAWVAYLVADFSFDAAARVAEPTIFQLMALAIVLFMASMWKDGPSARWWRPFTFGLVAVSACLYVYAYNFFIVPAVLVMILGESFAGGPRRVIAQLFWAVLGCGAAILSYAVVVYLTYGESLIQLYQGTIQPLSGRVASASASAWLVIMSTNIFRFDLPLLVAFGVALPVFAYRTFKEKNHFGLLVGALLVFLILQSGLAPDYQYRKLVIMGPLVILVISMALGYARPFAAALAANRALLIATLAWLVIVAALSYVVYSRVRVDLAPDFKRLSQICVVLLVLFLVAAVAGRGRFERALTVAGLATLILPGVYFSAQQLFSNPTYHYRDAMIAAAPVLNDHTTAGGWSYAFRLYNSSVPILSTYGYVYRPSGQQLYETYLQRLFAGGGAQYMVIRQGDPITAALGLEQIASYEIDVENTPVMAVYKPAGS